MTRTGHPIVPPIEDDVLAALAATDRQAALAEVVRQERSRLLRTARGILKDADLAGDAVQDVFIKAMHEPRFFDVGFRRGAWLHRVTRNLCLNRVRDRRRRGDILQGMDTPRSATARQHDHVLADERHTAIREAMGRLSEAHQQILEERFYRDLSYAEIAEVLDLKLGTVMSRLSRAKQALMGVLEGEPVSEYR